MKILRYIIFLSILSGIFFVIYRQSDKKWRISFKIAVLIAASAAGLIPVNTEAMEPPGNNNQVYQERLFSDQEFYSFEDNDQKVILVKTGDSAPSVPTSPGREQPSQFPTPPAGGRPSRPVYVPKYRSLGAGANPAEAGGGGGATEFDDQCPVPENQKSKVSEYDYRSNVPKNKKEVTEQCELSEGTPHEINEKFESNSVKKLVKRALANQRVKKEYEVIKKRINEGVNPIDIGSNTAAVAANKVLINGAHGRYLVEVSANQVNVLGIGARGNKKNIQTFERLMNEVYGVNLQY